MKKFIRHIGRNINVKNRKNDDHIMPQRGNTAYISQKETTNPTKETIKT